MTDSFEIQPAPGPIHARVRPPGSKSITNRALVCAALADGTSTLTGTLDSEDTRVMIGGLGRLGVTIRPEDAGRTLVVEGTAGRIPAIEADLFCAGSGTTIRFLTAMVTLGHGAFRLDGVERMRERPIADLLDALQQLGTHAVSENGNGCPPVVVHANGLPGGVATVRGDISSQFLSGLLMAAPAATTPVELVIDGPLVSQPYVRMTLAVMQAFGVEVETDDALRVSPPFQGGARGGSEASSHSPLTQPLPSGERGLLRRFHIAAPQRYHARQYAIEPDASAASYFWAAAAVTGGEVTVEGLSAGSLQGDVAFVDCLERMGCDVRRTADAITVVGRPLHGIDVGMNAISDTVQTLAVVALFAEGRTTIRHVAHIRHKETDRIAALAAELRKLGAEVTERADGLVIQPGSLRSAVIDTYDDHRMAMSFAIAGLRIPGVRLNNPGCTVKTYPAYFDDLASAAGTS